MLFVRYLANNVSVEGVVEMCGAGRLTLLNIILEGCPSVPLLRASGAHVRCACMWVLRGAKGWGGVGELSIVSQILLSAYFGVTCFHE